MISLRDVLYSIYLNARLFLLHYKIILVTDNSSCVQCTRTCSDIINNHHRLPPAASWTTRRSHRSGHQWGDRWSYQWGDLWGHRWGHRWSHRLGSPVGSPAVCDSVPGVAATVVSGPDDPRGGERPRCPPGVPHHTAARTSVSPLHLCSVPVSFRATKRLYSKSRASWRKTCV